MSTNKIILTEEQELFIRENYKTMNGFQLSAGTGLTLRTIKRRMAEFGLVRTEEEKKAVWSKRRMPEPTDIAKRNRKIEGGGRGNLKTKWHLDKWNAKNGPFSYKHMLVYYNGKFGDFSDLKLIRKNRYDSFVEDRIAREEKRQKREIVLAAVSIKKAEKEKVDKVKREESAKRSAISAKKAVAAKKYKDAEELRIKQFDEIKANSPKTIKEVRKQLVENEMVPVKLNHKTTIWVKKDKCEQQEDGTWVKKTPLNVVKKEELENLKNKKHGNTNKTNNVPSESGEPVEPIPAELDASESY